MVRRAIELELLDGLQREIALLAQGEAAALALGERVELVGTRLRAHEWPRDEQDDRQRDGSEDEGGKHYDSPGSVSSL